MREIKFRAWDKKNNYMDDDFFIHADNGYYDYAIRTYDTPNIEIEKAENDMFELMQYTGLKDMNGKEIYEGDIVRLTWHDIYDCVDCEYIGKVIFREDTCAFLVSNGKSTEYDWWHEEREVIGNIYENPGLLKESEEE